MIGKIRECYNLKSLNSSNFDTSQADSMSYMFQECYNLKSLNLSNFDTSKITDMGDMFYKFNSLEYIDISNFNAIKVKVSVDIFSHSLIYINYIMLKILIQSKSKLIQQLYAKRMILI